MNSPVVANFDNTVDKKEFAFRFKKDKLGNQRQGFKIEALVPSVEGIQAILARGGKGLDLLLECASDVVRSVIAGDVADNEAFNQTVYSSAKLKIKDADGTEIEVPKYSWEGIANQPKEARRTISTEAWEAFSKSYLEIMPAVAGKTTEQVGNAIQVFVKKFAQVKTNKPVLAQLQSQLALFTEHCPNAEDFVEILELLINKADEYMKSDDVEKLVANL